MKIKILIFVFLFSSFLPLRPVLALGDLNIESVELQAVDEYSMENEAKRTVVIDFNEPSLVYTVSFYEKESGRLFVTEDFSGGDSSVQTVKPDYWGEGSLKPNTWYTLKILAKSVTGNEIEYEEHFYTEDYDWYESFYFESVNIRTADASGSEAKDVRTVDIEMNKACESVTVNFSEVQSGELFYEEEIACDSEEITYKPENWGEKKLKPETDYSLTLKALSVETGSEIMYYDTFTTDSYEYSGMDSLGTETQDPVVNTDETASSSDLVCKDSDGGQYYNTKGTIRLEYSDGTLNDSISDQCLADGKTLTEYVCQPNWYYALNPHTCPGACVDGACVESVSNKEEDLEKLEEAYDEWEKENGDKYQSDAQKLQSQLDEILANINELRDQMKEQQNEIKYLQELAKDQAQLSAQMKGAINNFITYGVDQNTKKLGEGERAAVVYSYKDAYGRLPENDDELADAIRIASGRWPNKKSEQAEKKAKKIFEKIYKKIPDMEDPRDNAAVTVMAYGLRQKAENRNLESEKAGINTFKSIFGHHPNSTEDWNTMQAITYSGASRGADSDGDLLLDEREAELGTDPNNPDSDGDGYGDGEEVANGYNPKGEGKL